MREKGKTAREGYLSWRDQGLPLDREEAEVARRKEKKMLVYNGTLGSLQWYGENPVLG